MRLTCVIVLATCSLIGLSAASAQTRGFKSPGFKPAIQRGVRLMKDYGRVAVVDNYRGSMQSLQRHSFFRTKVGRRTAAGLAGAKTALTATLATAILGTGYLTYKPMVNLGRRLRGKHPLTFSQMLNGAQYRESAELKPASSQLPVRP